MSNLTQRIALFRKMKTIYKTEPKSSQSRPWAEQKWVENLFEGAFLLICFKKILFISPLALWSCFETNQKI